MPPSYPWSVCTKVVRKNSKSVDCGSKCCHIKCGVNISDDEYAKLRYGEISFDRICQPCTLIKDRLTEKITYAKSTRLSSDFLIGFRDTSIDEVLPSNVRGKRSPTPTFDSIADYLATFETTSPTINTPNPSSLIN